jgi:hypothetical protein
VNIVVEGTPVLHGGSVHQLSGAFDIRCCNDRVCEKKCYSGLPQRDSERHCDSKNKAKAHAVAKNGRVEEKEEKGMTVCLKPPGLAEAE